MKPLSEPMLLNGGTPVNPWFSLFFFFSYTVSGIGNVKLSTTTVRRTFYDLVLCT